MVIEAKKQAVVLAHNAFFPDEWNYTDPLQEYEHDGLWDILSYYERDERQKNIYFISDPSNFFSKQKIEGVHYETFTPIDQSWSRDKDSLYKDGKVFMKQSQVPKMMIGGAYMKNDSNVYFWREGMNSVIDGADAQTFETLYSLRYYNVVPYARDKNHVYILGQTIPDIDTTSVEILTSFYLQDKNNIVYFDGDIHRVLQWVDRDTFEVLSDGDGYDARDSKGYFYQGERIEMIVFE